MQLVSFFICIGCLSVCFFILYSVVVRYVKIKDLGDSELREHEKAEYLVALRKYCIFCGVCSLIDIICIFLPIMELRLILPIVSILFTGNIYQDLLDEIADFDTNKKDSEILKDFLSNIKSDGIEKSKHNKITKVDSDAFEEKKENDNNQNNKNNK